VAYGDTLVQPLVQSVSGFWGLPSVQGFVKAYRKVFSVKLFTLLRRVWQDLGLSSLFATILHAALPRSSL